MTKTRFILFFFVLITRRFYRIPPSNVLPRAMENFIQLFLYISRILPSGTIKCKVEKVRKEKMLSLYWSNLPGWILFQKVVIFYSTLSHDFDHFSNESIKSDTCFLNSFSAQVRIWNQISYYLCVRPPGGAGGPRAKYTLSIAFKPE